ncbi:hypothetical protein SLEP1_g26268 [Rubroshorea leprosula]|uniref:Peroxisomal and mitochondrial division factor 2-like n=1 Tax=Rubroshorea leprosula TaxID=152421 RepID=A0AAV5JSS9_9ROSI|nr:hypothetical protein SLEP1_g26268 [Rubroshorea leprosula]
MADSTIINGEVDDQSVEDFFDADQRENESKVSQLTRKVEALESEKGELIRENTEIKEKIKELTLEVDLLKGEEQQMKARLEDMERELDQSDDDKKLLDSIAARAVDLESEVARLQHDLINAMNEGEEANVEVGKLKKELREKGLKIEDLERGIESLKKAKAESEKKMRELERKMGVLEVREMEGKSKKLRAEEEIRDRIDEREREISVFKKKVEELEIVVKETGVELQKWETEKQTIERELRESENKARAMEGKILQLQNEVEEAEKVIVDLKEREVGKARNIPESICDAEKELNLPIMAAGSIGAALVFSVAFYLCSGRRQ